jgi:hypothetical protein
MGAIRANRLNWPGVLYMVTMKLRSRPLLACAVAIVWLVLGPLAVLYGPCVIMCDACDMTCPAAPGVEHAPRVDPVVAVGEAAAPIGELHLTVTLAPPAPPPKPLLSA